MKPDIASLPFSPGVYIMRSADNAILYIGKAKNLRVRVMQYFHPERDSRAKIPALMALTRRIDYIPCLNERDALVLEHRLVYRYQPFFNSLLKDSAAYPYIKLSMGEDFPRLQIVRVKTDDKSIYFGPYPKASLIKPLLRYLWRSKVLALRPCRWNFSVKEPLSEKKINSCLYFHTGQCQAPCAGKISLRDYRRKAVLAKMFLDGKTAGLKKVFRSMMKKAASALEYESAAHYRDFVRALEHMAEKVQVSQYDESKLASSMDYSATAQRLAGHLGLSKPVIHIEAFDTSNLFGREAVGAMVCFLAGEKNHVHYRRFRIKNALPEGGGDDFLMINEIVGRRLKQISQAPETAPDLFLIDGGLGQLAAAAQAVSRSAVKVPLAALAKKNEEIYLPGHRDPLRLDRSDRALLLLMKIRDEVHRFGISYHRKLRDSKLMEEE